MCIWFSFIFMCSLVNMIMVKWTLHTFLANWVHYWVYFSTYPSSFCTWPSHHSMLSFLILHLVQASFHFPFLIMLVASSSFHVFLSDHARINSTHLATVSSLTYIWPSHLSKWYYLTMHMTGPSFQQFLFCENNPLDLTCQKPSNIIWQCNSEQFIQHI